MNRQKHKIFYISVPEATSKKKINYNQEDLNNRGKRNKAITRKSSVGRP